MSLFMFLAPWIVSIFSVRNKIESYVGEIDLSKTTRIILLEKNTVRLQHLVLI